MFGCRTWPGPAWTAAQSLLSVLVSIQSLMNERPYHNEPGYEKVILYHRMRFFLCLNCLG